MLAEHYTFSILSQGATLSLMMEYADIPIKNHLFQSVNNIIFLSMLNYVGCRLTMATWVCRRSCSCVVWNQIYLSCVICESKYFNMGQFLLALDFFYVVRTFTRINLCTSYFSYIELLYTHKLPKLSFKSKNHNKYLGK